MEKEHPYAIPSELGDTGGNLPTLFHLVES